MPSYPLGQIPGYWLAHDSTDSGSQHYQLCWVTAESQEAIIRRTAPGLYPDSKGLPENRVNLFMLSAMRSIR